MRVVSRIGEIMRIIGGELRGRRLRSPPRDVRPTSDRVREALFGRLDAVVPGARVLDLYAGTGALGIEALSRGAKSATFVDRSARSIAVLRKNLSALGLEDRAEWHRGETVRLLRRWARADTQPQAFDLVLLDPPYDAGEAESGLRALVEARVLAPDATVVVESAKRHSLGPVGGLDPIDRRTYGDTVITRLAPGRRERLPEDAAPPDE
ncbi:MAG: 16S rRNA (guanine(966)-N(2))-methyltransferase RsmD [Proteobacteria bacterium]|nr:16S rRNA (guanine(966)-N(2))-methyltransferase RsmD [Pseudomonadota bacterium]